MTESKKNDNEQLEISVDYSADELKKLYEESFKSYDLDLLKKEDNDDERIVDGRIVRVTDKDVIVDVGLKSEGVINLSEFPEPEEIKVGDIIKIYIENFENEDGFADISLKKAMFLEMWPKLVDSNEKEYNIKGIVKKKVKGGMMVDLMGIEAFLPGSQIGLQPAVDMDSLINKKLDFRVIKLNYKRRNVVVSRRVILENEKENKKLEFIKNLKEGDVVEGIVKNITEFGAFIEIDKGIDGLLYITDMSWGRILHPSEIVAMGQKLKVMITAIDKEKGRISLGLKQLTPYPWEKIEEKYPIGSRQNGKVISIEDYGVFIEIEKGVEGLIHISEMSWTQHIKHPSEIISVGDELEAIVLSIDKKNERISLGLKQLVDNPWDKFKIGDKVKGKVVKFMRFGMFIEISQGIEGLLHVSNISWEEKDEKIEEMFKIGQEIESLVIGIDADKKRISLGLKQMEDDPIDNYNVDDTIKGKILEVKDKNLSIEMDYGIKGIVPTRLIAYQTENLNDNYKKDDIKEFKIVEIDKTKRRIILTDKLE